MAYFILFLSALGAATLLPGGSEALLLYYKKEGYSSEILLVVATAGNTLGSLVNYALGKYASSWAIQKKYIKALHVERAKGYFDRFGAFALLLSWMPIIGDPLTFGAGVLRYALWKFVLLVLVAKCARYLFLLYVASLLGFSEF